MKTSIKEKIKKITGVSISEKWLAVAAIMVLAVLLLPLLRLAFYTTPWYDDYSYGRFVKGFVGEEGILKGAWDGAVYTVRTWWYCWQGTFSSIFMMTLVPIAFHEAYYYVGIIIILLFFTCACMVFVKTVSAHVLKATRAVQIMLAVLVTATLLELIYTAQQGIFWYNAAVHYTFMHGCLFFLLAAVIKLLYAKHTATVVVMTILTTALSVMCGGSNYVTSLQGMLALLTITGLAALVKNKRFLALLFPIAVYAVALYFNMSAPGNGARAASYTGYGPVKSILYSFKSAAENAWLFTGVPMLIILAWFVLIIWNTVKRMKFSFAWPGLVTLFSFCFYATGFTSSYYGMGTEGLSRTWVVVKFTYQLLLFLNTAYWLGWWMHRREKKEKMVPEVKQWLWAYAAVGLGIFLCVACSGNKAGEYSSFGAYYYVHSGEAFNYYSEYQQRIDEIKNGGDVVEVKPYAWKPWFLFKGELSEDPSAETNMAMAEWYHKQSISLKVENETGE